MTVQELYDIVGNNPFIYTTQQNQVLIEEVAQFQENSLIGIVDDDRRGEVCIDPMSRPIYPESFTLVDWFDNKQSPKYPYDIPSSVRESCTCPTLLNGHHNGCTFSIKEEK